MVSNETPPTNNPETVKQADGTSANSAASAQPSSGEAAEAAQVLADLEQLSRERDTLKELLLRTRADFENYQKRVAKELQQERRFALWPLALDLLPVLDNFQRALESVRENSPLRQGVVMIYQQFLQVLRKHGIEPMPVEGKPFDPYLHQAVSQQPSQEHPPNTVLKVVEAGYYYHDRVLRPARVIVSTAPEPSPSGTQSASTSADSCSSADQQTSSPNSPSSS